MVTGKNAPARWFASEPGEAVVPSIRASHGKEAKVVILYVHIGDQGILENPGMRNVAISRHTEKLYVVSDGTQFCNVAASQMSETLQEEG